MKNRASKLNMVDKELIHQLETEKVYQENVLVRTCAVVKFLFSRGLPFRRDNKTIGSLCNGNFLMCLELVAEFDHSLANNLSMHGDPGKDHTFYLSAFIHEQFIKLMAAKVQSVIVNA